MSLLSVGTIAFDSVETPSGKRDDAIGGSVSYLGTAASYFSDVQMVSVIGEDFPEEIIDFFQTRKIDTSGIRRLPGKTFRWTGRYGDNLNEAQTLETQLNVLNEFDPTVPESYRDTEYVVLGNIEPGLQRAVVEQLKNPKVVMCDTMNFWIEGSKESLIQTLKHIDVLCINEGEARQLSGEHNIVKAVKAVRKMGPQSVIVKRGEYGALVYAFDEWFSAPALPLETIVDPTGAGDSFAGGLMGYLASIKQGLTPDTLRQGIIWGSVMASFNVEDFSLDRLKSLKDDEIQNRYKMFQDLARF